MRPANVASLGVKELYSLARDPVLLILMVYSFTIGVYSAATALPQTLYKAPIAVIDEDRSPLSARLVDALYPPHFLPPVSIEQAGMDEGMDQGRFTFALNIPPDFQRDVLAGRRPAVQLNADATRMTQAFVGSAYLNTILTREAALFAQRQADAPVSPVELALRVRFNPGLTPSWFGSVMQLINQVTLLSVVLTGAALIREREHGTIEHLLVMPVTPLDIMCAKVWSMSLVVVVACALSLWGVVHGWLAVPIEGSAALFLAGTLVHLFATTSMGIVMATVARSMPQFGLLLMLVVIPLQMLSGGMTPRESMPEVLQDLMLIAPTTHYVMLAQAILYRGAGLSVVWPQFLALATIGGIFFTVALGRLRKTIGLPL
ncbi:MAG: ABC transporter permease [Nitrospiraceae bacterium]